MRSTAALDQAVLQQLAAYQRRRRGATPTLRWLATAANPTPRPAPGRRPAPRRQPRLSTSTVRAALLRMQVQGKLEITSRPGYRLHIIIKEWL